MVAEEDLTNTINFRRLASILRRERQTDAPEHSSILELISKDGRENELLQWTKNRMSKEGFDEMLAFYIADDC